VTVPSGTLSYQHHGTYTVEFLTIEHDAGLELEEELVLMGQESGGGDKGGLRYTVNPAIKEYDAVGVYANFLSFCQFVRLAY